MAFETIIVDTSDHVTLITLNRPDALNALNSQLLGELGEALQQADKNDKVRAIVITGSEKAFAAGADITEMAQKSFVDWFRANDPLGSIDALIAGIRKPIIAAVSGYALGGGCELAMMCDFIIASEDAKFGQPEINLGVMAGMGGSQRLTRLVGKSKSMDMHLTGRMIKAEEAERAGLVARIVPAKKLKEDALAAAQVIAEKSLVAAAAIKEAVNAAENMPLRDGLLFERRLFHALFATEDQAEGMQAFQDKREPQFRDK